MSALRAWMQKHPGLTYYVLVFAISWGGILLLIPVIGIPKTGEDAIQMMPPMLVVMFAGPSVAGVLATALVHGRAGLRDLGVRLLRWRVGVRWYALALLFAPVVVAAVLLGLSRFSPEYLPGILSAEDKLGLVIFGLAWGLIGGGLLEELGWTGFAVPELRKRHGSVITGLIVGVLWGVWHFLIAFWSSVGLAGGSSIPVFIAGFLLFYLGALPAYRVLMVWVHDRTASLNVAMLMHAMFSASTLILQPTATGIPYLTWNGVLAVSLWGIVAAVAVANRGQMARTGKPPTGLGTPQFTPR
jgi:membrane protease YdiL (CAAX protease family)